MRTILFLLLAASCTSKQPEPAPMKASRAPQHFSRIDEHGWCVLLPDGMEKCTKNGIDTIAPPHHPEDRP